jgi:hypothetical protein
MVHWSAFMNFRITLGFTLLLCASPMALAQYVWINEKGVKQLSDRPPPTDIPEKRILKAPGKVAFNPDAVVDAPQDPATPSTPATPNAPRPPSLAERNASFSQRKADADAAAKRRAADAERKADIAANCDAARQNQTALDQGLRLSSYDKNGERGYMNDQERDDLRKKMQKVLVGCK